MKHIPKDYVLYGVIGVLALAAVIAMHGSNGVIKADILITRTGKMPWLIPGATFLQRFAGAHAGMRSST